MATPQASVTTERTRVIPGVPLELLQKSVAKKSRSRGKKASATDTALTDTAPAASDLPNNLVSGPNGLTLPGAPAVEEPQVKRPTLSQIINKRLKATSKKIQRISAYQSQDESTFNPEQRLAVASKPGLEAIVRELTELVKVAEIDEREVESLAERDTARVELLVQERVKTAVAQTKEDSRTTLLLLMQFLHMRELINNASYGQILPPNLARATNQQVAAVHFLYDALANGPLMGGHDDASERIEMLESRSQTEVAEGVTYAQLRTMIEDMTASPEEVEAGAGQAELDAVPEEPVANGMPAGGSILFMQASELEKASHHPASQFPPSQLQEQHVNGHYEEPVVEPQTDLHEPFEFVESGGPEEVGGQQAPVTQEAPAQPTAPAPATLPSFELGAEGKTNWADDVAEEAQQAQLAPPVTNGRGRGRGRGDFRGRGRGNPRAGLVYDAARQQNTKPARPTDAEEGWRSVGKPKEAPVEQSGGRGRGGRGRGDYRGRGNGEGRGRGSYSRGDGGRGGHSRVPSAAPAAAPASAV
ncbi:hypothetical protein E5Q_05000 [Mixia osmundae IAM 14324]|uniref:Uncharacterized protein n=1 Tax=Mixia osmundae (strain CBS 9802 / IAM 14324 / JCM 22182 / KY 12970) TaxID=764103 RepID=G7E655_MIXOS|nr:hypothetical protein E5Q_05000 [Mixia osmundae IAM 14324]